MKKLIIPFIMAMMLIPSVSASCIDDAFLLNLASDLNLTANETITLLGIFDTLCTRSDITYCENLMNNNNALIMSNLTKVRNETLTQLNIFADDISDFHSNMSIQVEAMIENYTDWFERHVKYNELMTNMIKVYNASANIEHFEDRVNDKVLSAVNELDSDFRDKLVSFNKEKEKLITSTNFTETITAMEYRLESKFQQRLYTEQQQYNTTLMWVLLLVLGLIGFIVYREKVRKNKVAAKIEANPIYQAVKSSGRRPDQAAVEQLVRIQEKLAQEKMQKTIENEEKALKKAVEEDKSRRKVKSKKPKDDSSEEVVS